MTIVLLPGLTQNQQPVGKSFTILSSAECAIRNFKNGKNGKNVIRPRSLRRLIRAVHYLQNKNERRVILRKISRTDAQRCWLPNLATFRLPENTVDSPLHASQKRAFRCITAAQFIFDAWAPMRTENPAVLLRPRFQSKR